ncbi:MurR/RpiR family transcriptional regulator [Marinomonas posidonica]|uniref:Transcriptional regulator, RpiR family n=1 Tax=Marinomonas posidonica (strain CECT 7376 / NCIMB 14433 / IVIA-Po-181) TaxID=491952 RepID=F6CUA2_MARPP|nr:MurR/RpiR family transcriptional regulator [Marinomonas posidonica]AEF55221.1 transcriptional regulator, RpiR family [Marinomonas posidonica IVIA-Po-181]
MSAPNTLEQLQQTISRNYEGLSKRLQQVARFLLEHPNTVALETVASLAEQCGVPPSTLVRFAAAFEYNGFSEMQNLFRQSLVEQTSISNYSERVKMNQNATGADIHADQILSEFSQRNAFSMSHMPHQFSPEMLSSAVDLLENAENIYLIGLRRAFPISSYFAYSLRHLNKTTHLIDGGGGMLVEQASNIRKDDVIIATTFSPYAQETVTVSEYAYAAGAKVIAITDSKISPLAGMSDVCFDIKEAEVLGFRSLTSSMTLAQTLLVSLAYRLNADGQMGDTKQIAWNH